MKHGDKKKFVMELGPSVPAAEVVRRGKDAGIALSVSYVYVLRSQARAGQTRPQALRPSVSDGWDTLAQSFAVSALELGLVRAAEFLQELRSRTISSLA